MSQSRRHVIGLIGLAPIAALVSPRGASAQASACYSPAALSFSQKSMRRSVGFVDQAPDPAKRCGTCAFFEATQNGCGKCQILSGGPVSAGAVCSSFAPRAK